MAKATDITLERLNRLGASMDALTTAMGSMTKMIALQLADVHGRLDRIEARLGGVEVLVRGYAGEQFSLANGILGAEQAAAQAHRRLDHLEDRPGEGA